MCGEGHDGDGGRRRICFELTSQVKAVLPGQREVAFFRSPVAHARITGLRKPAGSEGKMFFREDMPEVKAPSRDPNRPGIF